MPRLTRTRAPRPERFSPASERERERPRGHTPAGEPHRCNRAAPGPAPFRLPRRALDVRGKGAAGWPHGLGADPAGAAAPSGAHRRPRHAPPAALAQCRRLRLARRPASNRGPQPGGGGYRDKAPPGAALARPRRRTRARCHRPRSARGVSRRAQQLPGCHSVWQRGWVFGSWKRRRRAPPGWARSLRHRLLRARPDPSPASPRPTPRPKQIVRLPFKYRRRAPHRAALPSRVPTRTPASALPPSDTAQPGQHCVAAAACPRTYHFSVS